LVASDVGSGIAFFTGAVLVAAANPAVGVAAGFGIRRLVDAVAGRVRTDV
jgi:hypothetical protein